jgi:hypothetical protein
VSLTEAPAAGCHRLLRCPSLWARGRSRSESTARSRAARSTRTCTCIKRGRRAPRHRASPSTASSIGGSGARRGPSAPTLTAPARSPSARYNGPRCAHPPPLTEPPPTGPTHKHPGSAHSKHPLAAAVRRASGDPHATSHASLRVLRGLTVRAQGLLLLDPVRVLRETQGAPAHERLLHAPVSPP